MNPIGLVTVFTADFTTSQSFRHSCTEFFWAKQRVSETTLEETGENCESKEVSPTELMVSKLVRSTTDAKLRDKL